VAEGIERYWRLPEWGILNSRETRHTARFLAALAPEQIQRALLPDGLPFASLTSNQQQGAMEMQYEALAAVEREGGGPTLIPPDWWSHAFVHAAYVPAGWFGWDPKAAWSGPVAWPGPAPPFGGRTAPEALAAVRRIYPPASLQDVHYSRRGYFSGGLSFFFHNK
jgi:hypothetical protein